MKKLPLIVAALVSLFVPARWAWAETAKISRALAVGSDEHAWVVGITTRGTSLPVFQIWHGHVKRDAQTGPVLKPALPPIQGDPIAIAADHSGLNVLFSDLTSSTYFPDRPYSPGARWLDVCTAAPIVWCGDAAGSGVWALVEQETLAAPTTQPRGGKSQKSSPAAKPVIDGRLAILSLQRGAWKRVATFTGADGGSQFWLAARDGRVSLFWKDKGEISMASLNGEKWSAVERVTEDDGIRHGWAGATENSLVFVAGRDAGTDGVKLEVHQKLDGQWQRRGFLREGNENLTLDTARASVAIMQGRIGIARATATGIELGLSGLDAAQPVRFTALSAQRIDAQDSQQWRESIVLALSLTVLSLVLWTRRGMLAAPSQLPEGWKPAAIWRRAFATVIDATPAGLVVVALSSRFVPGMAEYLDVDVLRERADDPALQEKLLPVFLAWVTAYSLWCLFWELILRSTPGKLMFGCRVMSLDGGRPQVRQIVIRNFVRAVMVALGAPGWIITLMMMVVVTRNRQRMGDLLARTVVVEQGLMLPEGAPPGADDEGLRG